ncbi:hypothetical protein EDC39_101350 [Geothermobacter ehrlichii]|uniref:DUF2802 domain-containing protein n=1 Tax=Geothermobacter ehrlichii TaxID=213224 RepID=A0A5D3WRG3_9BACT|nr:hypothetical protein [Geothermobacter ehrlichii]TYP00189.1 hypothetical protein EDC39_101350 [Geothermobacter ehrlichii]
MFRPEYTFMLLAGTTLVSLACFILLFLKLNRLSRQLVRVSSRISENEEAKPAVEKAAFDTDLLAANMKAMIRQQVTAGNMSDRYRYINSLASHGLDPAQIAQILEIGKGEAEQLVKLASLRPLASDPEEIAA